MVYYSFFKKEILERDCNSLIIDAKYLFFFFLVSTFNYAPLFENVSGKWFSYMYKGGSF